VDTDPPDRTAETAAGDKHQNDDRINGHEQNATESDFRGTGDKTAQDTKDDEKGQNAPECTQNAPKFKALAGWRTAANLVKGSWRYERGSKSSKRTGRSRPLGTVPGGEERISYAKQNSKRQRDQKAAKRNRQD